MKLRLETMKIADDASLDETIDLVDLLVLCDEVIVIERRRGLPARFEHMIMRLDRLRSLTADVAADLPDGPPIDGSIGPRRVGSDIQEIRNVLLRNIGDPHASSTNTRRYVAVVVKRLLRSANIVGLLDRATAATSRLRYELVHVDLLQKLVDLGGAMPDAYADPMTRFRAGWIWKALHDFYHVADQDILDAMADLTDGNDPVRSHG